MPTNVLLESDNLVGCLRSAITKGEAGLANVPGLLARIIREDRWTKRIIQQTGEIQTFRRFEDFVKTPPLEGLGTDIAMLKRICANDKTALDLLDQVTVESAGRRWDTPDNLISDNITNNTSDRGTSATYALRRLRKNRPDLHARVLANELSPNGAMVEAGFRERTVQIPLDVTRAAMALRRHFTGDALTQLRNALGEDVKDLA